MILARPARTTGPLTPKHASDVEAARMRKKNKGLNIDNVIASLEAATAPSASSEKGWAKESLANLATCIVDTEGLLCG
jgi:hypothetical protein